MRPWRFGPNSTRLGDDAMHAKVEPLVDGLVVVEPDLAREFEERLAESSTLAFRVAYSVLRHRQDAEDIAQEAMVKAYRRFRQLRDRDRFRSWLVRIAWRMALDRRRADRRRAGRELAHAEIVPLATSVADEMAGARAEALWRAIDALPTKLRVVVTLASIEGHDIGAVARLVGVPEGTVKSRLFQARRRLRELLR